MSTRMAPLSIVMLGDVMLGRLVDEGLSAMQDAGLFLWGDTLPLLQGGMAQNGGLQIVTGNLECAGRGPMHRVVGNTTYC